MIRTDGRPTIAWADSPAPKEEVPAWVKELCDLLTEVDAKIEVAEPSAS